MQDSFENSRDLKKGYDCGEPLLIWKVGMEGDWIKEAFKKELWGIRAESTTLQSCGKQG